MAVVAGPSTESLEVTKMPRWVFFTWGLVATLIMVVTVPRIFGFGDGPYKDAVVLFTFASLVGLPGWLIVAALTVARWRHIPARLVALQNSPAIVGGILYAAVSLKWAR
jgi:hypothetical protein